VIGSWVNGQPGEALSVRDRGLAYGDGVFETMAVINGRVRLLEAHLARLAAGLSRLAIAPPDREQLTREIAHAAALPGAGVLKLIVSRGVGARGYRPDAAIPSRILSAWPAREQAQALAESGVELRICRIRFAEQPALAGLKTLNRLEQVLARGEWGDDPPEGLMLDGAGRVISGTMSNLFAVLPQGLVTPALERCGVRGVMRGAVLRAAAAAGGAVIECDVTLADLERASELFLTNALIGAWPVRRLAGRELAIGPAVRAAQRWIAGL
jgi:4-amino-4-deoxychorismate lyase